MNDNQRPEVTQARRYLESGGLGEVIGFTDLALRNGSPKVQSDTDMAMALCVLAGEAIWHDISTVPFGVKVDVWIWEVDGAPTGEGFRFPEVEVIGEQPCVGLKTWRTNDDGQVEEDEFWPHENGCYASNWRHLPANPALPAIRKVEA